MFPETLSVENIEVEWKQNSQFPAELVIKCFVLYLSTKKYLKTAKKWFALRGWQTNLLRFQGARLDHVPVESSCCCFPRKLVNFVYPRELVSFVYPRELVSFVRPREFVSFDP